MTPILLIEDNPDVREAMVDILEYEGYAVFAVENGREGLDLLCRMPQFPSAIVLDLDMPVMNGREFLRHLQARPEWQAIPVVITSGALCGGEVFSLHSVSAVFRKPLDLPLFLTALAGCCAQGTALPECALPAGRQRVDASNRSW